MCHSGVMINVLCSPDLFLFICFIFLMLKWKCGRDLGFSRTLETKTKSSTLLSSALLMFLRPDELLGVVDQLLSHHDDQQLLGQFNETTSGSTLWHRSTGISTLIVCEVEQLFSLEDTRTSIQEEAGIELPTPWLKVRLVFWFNSQLPAKCPRAVHWCTSFTIIIIPLPLLFLLSCIIISLTDSRLRYELQTEFCSFPGNRWTWRQQTNNN